jgi:hypothetical protein
MRCNFFIECTYYSYFVFFLDTWAIVEVFLAELPEHAAADFFFPVGRPLASALCDTVTSTRICSE